MVLRNGELEGVIDNVVKSYDGHEEINNLDTAALPNKRAVVEAYKHLRPVLFAGFYSVRSLDRDNLRFAISEHLYPAYETLVEQIGRALAYEERFHGVQHPPGFAEEVVLSLFRRLPEVRLTLNSDVTAAFEGDPAAKSVEEIVFSYPAVHAITAHRIAHELHLASVPIIPRIIAEYAHSRTGVDIHPGARIGSHFFLDHGTGVVIGETSIIGDRVKIYQGVTLGALSTRRTECSYGTRAYKRHPTIEDNVTIYAGATILGGETVIGAGSVIGGNVWLTQSVPPNSKIFGRARE
ncbi:MAG TPA: serine O-acetyltransferase EpsC [Polyangiaceae bacterium]|nr:serine O-acetyltransferase EpsC [Polyangiaceae bacterium]